MSSRVHTHSPLPAPALHMGVTSAQSKSHVLAGVQDAYWSDDEADDAECPLCLEEMDISDLNFKPCICGYQICRFCWHHIKENLNGRCPACRREYTDEAVQFKPVNKEDHKRLTQQKKQRERERKELDALNRRHLANVRVVQRNVVYVVGIGPRFAKEELIPTLRSNEYFGQYGKISKIVIVKRTPTGGRAPVVGLYITYQRREDAARAIAAVDGAPSPGGGHDIMRASHGTTKYCMAFLRGVSCTDHSCMNLHEWGDEKDCFTKEDLTTLKHTMKDMENRPRNVLAKKTDEPDAGLPRAASWANKGLPNVAHTALHNNMNSATHPLPSATRQTRRTGANVRTQRSVNVGVTGDSRIAARERKAGAAASSANRPPSQASSSRPATPASMSTSIRPATPSGMKAHKSKEALPTPPPAPQSPTPSAGVESDAGSGAQDMSPTTSPPLPPSQSTNAVSPVPPAVPPGIPSVPPGLSAPPGLPPPARGPLAASSSQTSQGSYQMSTQAQALVADIKARREASLVSLGQSPFPDFDRMLQNLSATDSGFSFNLDPKLVGDHAGDTLELPDFEPDVNTPFSGTFLDTFPALRPPHSPASPFMPPPPGLGYPQTNRAVYDSPVTRSPALERPSAGTSSYTGSFNPFASEGNDESGRRFSPLDEERKVSRFGFARGRQGSTSSPMHASPLSQSDSLSHGPYSELSSPVSHTPAQWSYLNRQHPHDSMHQPTSAMSSPLAQHAQAQPHFPHPQQQQQTSRFQPFDNGVSEAQLRDFITTSRERATSTRPGPNDQQAYKYHTNQPFNDPAIMSARLASPVLSQPVHDNGYSNQLHDNYPQPPHMAFGPPPGISYSAGVMPSPSIASRHSQGGAGGSSMSLDISQASGSAHVSTSTSLAPSPVLSSSDFPALPVAESSTRREQQRSDDALAAASASLDSEAQAKAERKAAKKAAAAERAAEKQKAAQEKALARAAEKERLAQEKAAEKEKAAAVKAERERAAQEKAERIKAEEERAEREKEKEKQKIEKEHAAQAKPSTSTSSGKQAVKATKRGESEPPASSSPTQPPKTPTRRNQAPKATATPAPSTPAEPVTQAPILAKMPKKNKPVTKPIKIPNHEPAAESPSALASAATSEAPQLPDARAIDVNSNNSRSHSVEWSTSEPTTVEELLTHIDTQLPWMNISKHPFFDTSKINPAAKMPLEYGPLVHALSALSVGGGSFANNMPSGSIDNAVSSFQQLLETLTQTISDLLRLLPRTTWDDSSSFDGVLRDMLKGDDFLDDGGDDQNNQGKEDEVAALTMALERRARWMEVQLSKLEELHRDINTAAVRAVLSFNDNGWDPHGFMPRVGNTLQRFDRIGMVEEGGELRLMTADELERRLGVAKEAAVFAETELREVMQSLQTLKPLDEEAY